MRRPVFVLALLAMLLAPAAVTPRSVAACSAGQDFDAVAESDVIITGRVVNMRLAPDHEGFGTPQTAAVWVDFEVDRYLKGSGPSLLSALDTSSVAFVDDQSPGERETFEGAAYWGASGACGTLDADPRGQYWVTGLSEQDGIYRLTRPLTFGAGTIGSGPDDPEVLAEIEELESRLGPGISPSSTGHGPTGSHDATALPLLLGSTTLGLLAAARRLSRYREARR